jgi:hypothetical protein
MVRRKLFLRWALLAVLILIGAFIALRLGWLGLMYESDFTKLTVITLISFAAASAWCGLLTWRANDTLEKFDSGQRKVRWAKGKDGAALQKVLAELESARPGIDAEIKAIEDDAEWGWYVVSLCMGLGLLGTVWGIFAVFYGGLSGFAGGDTKVIEDLLERLSSGMATATITTIVGLICSMALHLQYHMLNNALERMKEP